MSKRYDLVEAVAARLRALPEVRTVLTFREWVEVYLSDSCGDLDGAFLVHEDGAVEWRGRDGRLAPLEVLREARAAAAASGLPAGGQLRFPRDA